ncbi:MAG TPA: fused MFS/spermidine synthase [Thermoanaerobaculia bacterium]|nr:fused MFS/spermidine synthase [Thermoanaerobaculia bacterium]
MSSSRDDARVYFLFFASGFASLADEIVWFKLLDLTFGVTTLATATLLAVFMAGLGLGSAWAAKRMANLRRPLFAYGAVEAGIGLFALATPLLFSAIDAAYVAGYRSGGGAPATLFVLRFVLSAAALLPPTALMGASYPLLSRRMETDGNGSASGLLYAVNTAGAVAGTALCGFWAIRRIGVHATLIGSACVSLIVALVAVFSSREIPAAAKTDSPADGRKAGSAALAAAVVTGVVALAAEVLWTRVLVLHLGSSVYSFSLMLAIQLAGLVVGSAWAARRAGDPRAALFRAALALSATLFAQVFAFRGFEGALLFGGLRIVRARTFADLLVTRLLVTSAYLLPPTIASGAIFGFLLRAWGGAAGPGEAPRRAGSLYAANTFGGIAGALGAGLLAIPLIGTQNTLFAAAALAAVVALLAQPRRRLPFAAVAACAAGIVFARPGALLLSAGVLSDVPRRDLLFWSEGLTGTIAVKQIEKPRPWRSLELNGVNVAGTSPDLLLTQKLQAHLPLVLADHPRRVVHIGFGSGGTAWSVSRHAVEEIRIVEISPEVLRTSDRFFRDVNHGVLADPRVRAVINDGRNFVLASPERFDAILSDSIHPRYAGNGALYTEEYFRLCARRLRPGGVVSMWLPTYALRPQDYRGIVRAFRDVFPNVSIWYPHAVGNAFTIVIATPEPTIDLAAFAARLTPAIRADLAEVGEDDPAELLSNLILAPRDVGRWVAATPPHRDDVPTVEYESGRVIGAERTWYETLADLAKNRSPIEAFVTGLSPGDPLADRLRSRSAAAALSIRKQLEELRPIAAGEP